MALKKGKKRALSAHGRQERNVFGNTGSKDCMSTLELLKGWAMLKIVLLRLYISEASSQNLSSLRY